LVAVYRLSRDYPKRQTVVYRGLSAREQYSRRRHKVVKDYLGPMIDSRITRQSFVLR
jgi:hypothetical protein